MSEATEVELIPLLRQYADVADAGGKAHWATAMRRAVGDLTAAREQIAELDGTVRTLATVQTQLIAERDAERARVAELEKALDTMRDKNIDTVMAMSDEQISALVRSEGRDPNDVAKLTRQLCTIAGLRVRVAELEAGLREVEQHHVYLNRKVYREESKSETLRIVRRALLSPSQEQQPSALTDVAAERRRQQEHEGWTPKDSRRDLVRAAALLVAEIERIDRSPSPEPTK